MDKRLYVVTGDSYKDFKIKSYPEGHEILELFEEREIFSFFEAAKVALLIRLDAERETILSLITTVEGITEESLETVSTGEEYVKTFPIS